MSGQFLKNDRKGAEGKSSALFFFCMIPCRKIISPLLRMADSTIFRLGCTQVYKEQHCFMDTTVRGKSFID